MTEPRNASSLFVPGHNCWRVEHATRVAFLVDGDAYFKAFVAAAELAQRSLLITGWDFHSRTRLLCDDQGENCHLELGAFLNDLTRRKRDLEIHVLIWDYPMIFGLDREWAPLLGLGWKPRRRVHFRYDNTHPIGGSHHQKLVVVDDAIAFCGGIDLTCRRWDTRAHAADDLRRVIAGTPYPPFHDMAMAVEGEAARAVGDLIRERWRKATGDTLHPVATARRRWTRRFRRRAATTATHWPPSLDSNLHNVNVAIARTEPPVNGSPGVREVEALYLDLIASAQHSIYIENQYFTAERIGAALAARLAEKDGPEVILVLRELSHGWLEELTMQTLRTRLIRKLREADRYDRFRVFFPFIAGLKAGTCIDVHSKMIIVDDDVVRIGSSNIANRSMGLDTECDFTVAAHGRAEVQQEIRALRSTLLSEHLGTSPEAVQAAVERSGSLRGAIAQLTREDRTLKPLTDLNEASDTVLNMVSVADPERPVAMSDLVKLFTPDVQSSKSMRGWLKLLLAILVIAALTALWKFTPLSALLEPQKITAWAKSAGSSWWTPLLVILAYAPASVVMFPRPVITLFAVVAFGPWLGFAYAMAGVEFAAWLSYVVGQRLSRGTVRRVAGQRLNRVIDVLQRRGLIAITALRLVPLAPFSVEGVVAGALRIKLWHFMVGTAIGILPGTLAATVFGDQLQAALRNPASVNYWLIAAVIALLAGATWFVRRWLIRSSSASPQDMGPARVA
jgi:phosphatidylserine/phosphatidylglycerophosphate/cardiolipin synthase-like enzyme/uncharacterized membrane protein YdjX (TVP38/TMEM64 family)